MKLSLLAAGLGLAFAVPTAATAQSWQPINARQANLYDRIERGVRTGALNRAEATRLRTQFQALDRLERRYRAGGLSRWERNDLNQRFDALSARIRIQKNDRQGRR
jgi:hypothetical protein